MILNKKNVYSLTSLCLFTYIFSISCILFLIVGHENQNIYQIIMSWLPFISSLGYNIIIASISFDMYKIKIKNIILIETIIQIILLISIIFINEIISNVGNTLTKSIFFICFFVLITVHIVLVKQLNNINEFEIIKVQNFILNYQNSFFEDSDVEKNIHFSSIVNILMIIFLNVHNELVYYLIIIRFVSSLIFFLKFKKFQFERCIYRYFIYLFFLEITFFIGIFLSLNYGCYELSFILIVFSCFKTHLLKEKIMVNEYKKQKL